MVKKGVVGWEVGMWLLGGWGVKPEPARASCPGKAGRLAVGRSLLGDHVKSTGAVL